MEVYTRDAIVNLLLGQVQGEHRIFLCQSAICDTELRLFTTFDIETVFRSRLLWRLSYEFGLKTLVRNLLAIILCLFIPCHCKYAFLREDLGCSCRHIACVLNHSNTFAAKVFRLCSTLAVLYIALEVFFLILDDFNTMLGIIC